MNIPQIGSGKITSTTEEEYAQKADQSPVANTGLIDVKDELQSAAASSNKFQELVQQSEITGHLLVQDSSGESASHKGDGDDQVYKSSSGSSQTQTTAPHHGTTSGGSSSHSSTGGSANQVPSDASPPNSHGTRTLERGGSTTYYHSDGTVDSVDSNGDIVHANKDGSGFVSHSDGSVDYYDANHHKTGHTDKDGKTTVELVHLSSESSDETSKSKEKDDQ